MQPPHTLRPCHFVTGRHLLNGNPLVKEINFVGHSVMPNIILPKPAVSINIAKPTKPPSQPKVNINGNHQVGCIVWWCFGESNCQSRGLGWCEQACF